mgnify:CR=1 FL=1
MYSILIKKDSSAYTYAIDDVSGEVFSGTLAETKEKFSSLLQKYPISKLVIVHNTTVTTDLSIVDVE